MFEVPDGSATDDVASQKGADDEESVGGFEVIVNRDAGASGSWLHESVRDQAFEQMSAREVVNPRKACSIDNDRRVLPQELSLAGGFVLHHGSIHSGEAAANQIQAAFGGKRHRYS